MAFILLSNVINVFVKLILNMDSKVTYIVPYKPHVRAFLKYFTSLGHIPYDPFMF